MTTVSDDNRTAHAPEAEQKPAPPIESRFLFVDVAAQRAKQLRRGALPRLSHLRPDPSTGQRPLVTVKLERVAMDEVKQGLIDYRLPDGKSGNEGVTT